ncbi:ATP-binding protein [Clostridium oceanicum]|uniref:ATP-binding protein n=1 Tax=Clostridium oceanicum TaxID=1543 RepID=A0ABN1JAT4_9CLOT
MKYFIEISKIIDGAIKLDKVKVENYIRLLMKKLEKDGDDKAAIKLKGLLEKNSSNSLNPMDISSISKTPVDFESRIPMADVIMPESNTDTIILSNKNEMELDAFLLSYKKSDELYSLGLDLPNTLIMFGPPGCGKTKCASYIASKLELPLIVARLDSMISSYLGTTAKNIRNLFEYAQKTPCVLFLDEFDAIAKARDDNNELGELKRVVNSLLQNIDSLGSNTLLVAATNHEELLDKAIWRRFHYKMNIVLPDLEGRKKLIRLFIKNIIKITDKELEMVGLACKGMNGAEIEEVINKAIQKSIIFENEFNINSIFNEIFTIKINIDSNLTLKQIQKLKIKYLRGLDEKIFSYSVISNILKISKSQISVMLKE